MFEYDPAWWSGIDEAVLETLRVIADHPPLDEPLEEEA